MAFTSKVVPIQRDFVPGGLAMPRFHGEGKALSIRVCTLPSHILFFDSLCIYNMFHLIQTPSSSSQNENILLAAAGAEVHIDRVQLMRAVDA